MEEDLTTLASVLNLGIPKGYYILDLKDKDKVFLDVLIGQITTLNFPSDKLAFQTEDIDSLATIKNKLPMSSYIFLSRLKRQFPWLTKPSASNIIRNLSKHKINIVSLKGRKFIDKQFINSFKKNNIRVIIWNINDLSRVKQYIAMGIDGIITDRLTELSPMYLLLTN